MKISKLLLNSRFDEVCKLYNLKTRKDITLKSDNPDQKSYYSDDYYKMDYNSNYGGYFFALVHSDTSVSDAFYGTGYSRLSANEAYRFLNGMIEGYRFLNKK